MSSSDHFFERASFYKPTSTVLFKKSDFDCVEITETSIAPLIQTTRLSNLSRSQNIASPLTTPPMPENVPQTPNAPVKSRKHLKKVNLKPKKLVYTEQEVDLQSTTDSGIFVRSTRSSNTFCTQRTVKCNKVDMTKRSLRCKVDRTESQTNDKENSYIAFNPEVKELSQCDSEVNWQEKLRWLQPRRDVGLWIECCRDTCKKWRYVEEYHDPTKVPVIWYCEMNDDKRFACCDIPEQPKPIHIEEDLIENAYNAGSIVWGQVGGFPWWPGIVNDCPDTNTYYELSENSLKPVRYFVTFFNEHKLENAWLRYNKIKSFASHEYSSIVKKTKYHNFNYKNDLDKAYQIALTAVPMSILERLKKFSFLAQYERIHKANESVDESQHTDYLTDVASMEIDIDSDEEIIPPSNSEKAHMTLREFYHKRILPKKQNSSSNESTYLKNITNTTNRI